MSNQQQNHLPPYFVLWHVHSHALARSGEVDINHEKQLTRGSKSSNLGTAFADTIL